IDRAIDQQLEKAKIPPSPIADDAEFLRRVSLDLAGRIPRVAEVRAFLADRSPDKRRRLVDRLLGSRQYATNFANLWRAQLLPPNGQMGQQFAPRLEAWLRKDLADNVPYDRMVRQLLTVSMDEITNGDSSPDASVYYAAQEYKPENLAASTSRLFLGIKVECAQCHNHPFATWTRQQFWQYATFFAGLDANTSSKKRLAKPPELRIPNTDRFVQARFLDGKRPPWKKGTDPRRLLADWMTSPDNPYFARAAVNRLWAHFFGIGLVEPVDDLSAGTAPNHPELFSELSRQFVSHGYDLKFLIRAITTSRAYGLSSTETYPGQDQPGLFARMAIKGLTPEQLFDSLAQATGYRDLGQTRQVFFGRPTSMRSEFLARFDSQDRPTEVQTSILQALALMNGKFTADATSLEHSETLMAVAEAPFLATPEKQVETLFLTTLSRPPQPAELKRFVGYVQRAGKKGERSALADVFWALLNSSEFMLNH
ncbi:MAG TPA: DUF1549 and DUF1553 domain-containing protein, partial [Gemmataceae bacterium]|nr:DUF1549 and DUF1553 domain-containing protein [Gemmataceae bacterium]